MGIILFQYLKMKTTIALISFFIMVLAQGGASKDLPSHIQTKLVRTADLDKSMCAVPSWEGDSLCDDINNNEGCNWDGGDCCPPHSWTFWNLFCEDCQCLDPNADSTAEELSCQAGFWANDPFCDDGNNTPECNFDGGACCNNNNPIWDYFCTECECLEE